MLSLLFIVGIASCVKAVSDVSVFKGSLVVKNASVELNQISLENDDNCCLVCGRKGSVVVVRGCVVGMGKDDGAGAFDLSGSIGVLTNITLKGWRRGGEIYSGRLFGGKGYGGEKGGGEEKGDGEGERGRGRGRGREGDGEGIEGSISVSESRFSSFCVSSAPFLSSPSIPLMSLSKLTFFNISTANDACSPSTTTSTQTSCFMSSCSFSSVNDAYDGGIVHSLNNPLASLSVSNTSFVGCCRTRNVECIGTSEVPLKPDRQNETFNGANSFTWCEWSGSRTTGEADSTTDGISSGGAIFMYNKGNGELSVSNCLFNNCFAYSRGGGIMCLTVMSVRIENNVFNACTAQNQYGGGMYVNGISTCARISGCEFQNCKAYGSGGGLFLENFQLAGTGCIEAEKGEGEGACMFDCSFTSCSVTNTLGGGMRCANIPITQFKMRSIQFISCSATAYGGGLYLYPYRQGSQNDIIYCYFLFFHECKCRTTSTPYGHDVEYVDTYNVYLNSGNPFFECYTTNADEKRMCYAYNYSNAGAWTYQHTEKKDWLKDKTIYVSVSGNDTSPLCGVNESNPCLTVKKALEMCEVQISLAITLMEGDHTSEATTIEIGSKKISVIGKDKEKCSIGTGALSSPSAAGTLFSVTTGHLGLLHIKVDCNSNLSPSSPSVVVVSDGSGSLSLEDVITTSVSSGDYVMSSSVFVVPLSQLSMVDVEIKDMNVAKPLFSELDLSSPSSSSSLLSLSSTALYLTATASGDSVLANVKVTNVKLTEGDGVVVAKSVKAGETFVVKNVTIEDCECKTGSGGGIKVELESSSSKLRVGSSTAAANEETKLNRCKCNKYGGGMMLYLENIGESSAFDISMMAVDFSGCTATLGGKFLFVNGSNCVKWGISSSKFNVPRNTSAFDELEGFDRSDEDMKKFPLNVFLDTFPAAAHVGKAKNQLGGYDSQFCGFAYYPCATITHAAQLRYAGVNKKIELDSGLELAEVVSMSDAYKWEIFCTGNEKSVKVVDPETTGLQYLIDVQSECSISSIDFSIPTVLSGAPSLILANSTLLTLSECSVVCSSNDDGDHSIGYVFVKAIGGDMILEKLLIDRTLVFESSSLVQFVGGVNFVRFSECKVSSVEKKYGNGGWVVGTVGVDRGAGLNGRVEIDTCTVKNCKCHGKDGKEGRGGGLCVSVTGEGSVVVNGSTKIDGCEANKLEANEGTGGGLQLEMLSTKSKLEIASEVKFSSSFFNKAKYGKDVFVSCGSGVLLDSKIDATTFKFFDSSEIPTDVLKLCGSEDGNGEKVIPLFVYLFTIESKLTVDGSGERALDHSYCGFEKFGCETINYCMSTRVPKGFQRVEVSSESSIKDEVIGPSFDVSVSGKVTAGEEITRVKVNVVEEGSSTQDWFVGCSNSLTISSISFVVKGQLSSRRRALIHSSSTLRLASCSVSFESGAFTGGKIGYNVLNVAGGELIVDGLMMESVTTLTMNGKSPITISNGEKLEIKNSRVSGVTVEGGSVEGRGCISAAIKEGGSAVVDNCSISTTCTGGGGMKGGGMMISAENGGSLEINSVTFTGCQVPTEDNLQKGRGMGGGMFVELADTMGSFQMEGVTFSRCNAWKGKKVFISGNELDDVMSNEQLKWGLSASDEKSLDELCGWERASTDEGYVIPLVVYLWRNWSKDGFVSNEKGGDFSGCGFSEAPCSSINHLISLRYSTLGKGESQISIGDSGLLSHSISFLSSLPTLPDSEAPAVVIKGTKKGTAVTISDEDGNDLKDSMISSNVSLSFVNVSFTKPSTTTNHAVFIESSGTNSVLSVTDCSFGSAGGNVESFECCLIKVNGGSAAVQSCTLNKINELKGFIAFSQTASQVTIQNVNISSATLKENSLISMIEEENQMNGNENTRLNGNKPVLKVVYCSFENIINEGSRASAIELGSFDYAMKCTIEDCTMSTCRSDSNTEGGGMKLVLKSEESVLKVNGSTFSTCRCSTGSGRGGGLYIDGADPRNVNIDDESQIPSLNFKIVNILFRLNDAFVGKDIFIKCHSIGHQINETLFSLNYNQESLGTNNSICGSDSEGKTDMDVIPLITFFKGLQVFLNGSGDDGRRCGAQGNPCSSINEAIDHIEQGVMNAILIDGEGTVTKECVIGDLNVNSYKKTQAIVKLKSKIEKSAEKDCIMEFINESAVERCSFEFEDTFEASHSYIMKVKNGSMEIQKCEFYSSATAEDMKLSSSVVSVESGELRIFDSAFRDLHSTGSILLFNRESNVTLLETSISNIKSEGDVVSVGGKAKVVMKIMRIENVSVASERCVVAMEDAEQEVSVLNCSFEKSANSVEKGSMMQIRRSKEVKVEICVFDGEKEEKEAETVNEEQGRGEKLCEWSGSLIDIENSNVEMKETTVMKSKEGGLWVSGGSLMIENSKFENNNPSVEGYPSARRNVICTGNSELNVASVKGGDGLKDNSSLWILDEGCQLGGIASERTSSFFIPVLEEVKNTTQASGGMDLSIRGKLLLPCNLSLKISMKDGDVELIQTQKIEENECVSENEIHSVITSEQVEVMGKKTEVSMSILFGKGNSLSSNKLVVINKTVSPSTGDDRISEGGNKNVSNGFSINTLIIIIFAVLFIIVLIVAIVLAIRWRKSKRRTEELEEIVNDTVKKDPKAFEMVTMDMSPEDQWRKAEKDAERINNEKMKIRYGGKKMAHSESSEYLLAESGSTEYILGHDSDKIPNWALEKADEKEDDEITRKRSPSPSISSTSTNDSDSSFVRMEDMCPTTSSMSNLVDAMACSSPHEKLIVDLRDSLFMLLHGKNEKKEMAIGNLQQREMTGAQILFWVANGALHSFDEMEVPLQSLDNLSPHIVLFSEHMVITIALHSDCSSDDSDSSSISSSTLATSSSDCSSINKRNKKSPIPSSAFEEDDDSMKESLRWKAPELMMNRKMVANKKTVAFTIGMMLWECLTLQIPFGEYEAAAAGQKIVNGERPDLKRIEASSLNEAANICLQMRPEFRPKLGELKREFIKLFPAGATVLTISDAVDYETVSDNNGESVVVEVESCTTMNEM